MKKITQKTVQQEIIESTIEYYKNNIINLEPLTGLNFRHFRYRLPDGYFYKVKEKIRNSENFKKSLIENEPLDVYYSTASWLNPHIIGSKLDNDLLKNVMLSCDLAFDIDVNQDLHTIEETRLQAIALTDYLNSRDIPVRYFAFSGSKGFHVVCNDPWVRDIIEEDPRKREASAVEKRKEIVMDAKNYGLFFDEKVTIDTRRIIRVPGTINSKTGFVCTVLSKKELESDLETIFKLVPSVGSFAPRISLNMREMTDPSVHKISGSQGRLGVRPRPKPTLCYSTFYTSNIPGTVLKIPVLEFGGWMKIGSVDAIVNRVQEQYGLGDMFLFSDRTRYWTVSLKAVSQRRVEKILFAADSLNLNQCKKYGCAYIRIGKSIDVNGNVVQDAPLFLRIYESDLRGQASRTHYEFFSSLGVKTPKKEIELCGAGKEKLEIVHAIIE
jgi:DNA primase catalytic subunit